MKKKQAGYSLMELIIVITLLGILGIGAVGLFFSTLKGSGKSAVLSDVKEQGDFALIAIERVVRNSVRVISCTAPNLVVELPDGSQKTIAQTTEGGQTKLTIDGEQITGNELTVPQFSLTCEDGNRVKPDKVTVRFTLRKGNQSVDRPEDVFESVFQTSVTLRNF